MAKDFSWGSEEEEVMRDDFEYLCGKDGHGGVEEEPLEVSNGIP